jgi:hypothetical protein
MQAWPNPENDDIGIINSIAKSYTYDSVFGKWLTPNDDKVLFVTQNCADDVTSFSPSIEPNCYTTLGNIHSLITSLVINCVTPTDTKYAYSYKCKFTTPVTLGITAFSVLDDIGATVTWMGSAPSLKASKTYYISILNKLAIIAESV